MQTTTIALGDAGVLAPGRWRPLRALGWMVLLFVLFTAVSFGPAAAAQHAGYGRVAVLGILAAMSAVIYLLYAFLVRGAEQRVPGEVALAPLLREFGIGLLVGLGMFTLVFASLRLLGVYTLAPGHWNDWGTDLMTNVGTGLREELIARLIVFRLLMRAAGPWPALVISAAIFGALHLANPNATLVAATAIAIEAGLMLAAFYLLTGRIWVSVGVHAAWNFAQGSIFGARVSGGAESGSLFTSAPIADTPDWLSGGAFGPEASLSAIVVGAAVFVVVIAAARRRGAL